MKTMPVTITHLLLGTVLLVITAGCGETGSPATSSTVAPSAGEIAGPDDDHASGDAAHDKEGSSGAIKLTPQQLQSAAIKVASAGPATIRERLPLYGVVAPNAERVREITPRFPVISSI